MECFGCNILLKLIAWVSVVEKLSYDGNLSKQMPLEPSYICFFFFALIWMLLHILEMKKISHRPYLLFDDT